MKITICVQKLTGGGAERVASLWAEGFVRLGHEVSIIVSKYDKGDHTYVTPDSVKIYNVGSTIKPLKFRYLLNKLGLLKKNYWKKLNETIHFIKPDVVIGVSGSWAWDVKSVSKDLNIKIIQTEHNSFERFDDAPLTQNQILQKFYQSKEMDHVTVLTQADKNILGDEYKNVTVLPNPLTFEPSKTVPVKKNVILATGRFNLWYVKGFDLLFEAWGNIARDYPDWKLQIAGTGNKSEIKKINEMIRQYSVPPQQVELLGFCHDMLPVYRDASVFVLSSRYEGFGMVLTEAMSQGCACIAADFKGRQGEIITSEDQGLLVSNNSANALSNAIIQMITNSDYRALCQKNAIMRSNYFRLDNIMKMWTSIINNLRICKE